MTTADEVSNFEVSSPEAQRLRTLRPAPVARAASAFARSGGELQLDQELSPAPDRARHAALDGIRGLAIGLILVHHAYSNLIPVGTAWGNPLPGSFLGVDIFFALSGYLITSLLLREQVRGKSVRIGRFYARRGLRLLPALYVFVAVYVAYSLLTGLPISAAGTIPTVTFWQNWASGVPGGFVHLWSLAVEEQFYLLWPVVLMILIPVRRRTGLVVGVLVALLIASNLYRILSWSGPASVFVLYVRPYSHGDGLVVGAIAAYLVVKGRVPTRGLVVAAWISSAFLVWCVTRYSADAYFYYAGGFTLVGIATSILILASVQTSWLGTRVLRQRWLCVLGIVSFGLYLWHYPIFLEVQRYGADWSVYARLAVAAVLTAACTAASWFIIERPFLRWKRRLAAER